MDQNLQAAVANIMRESNEWQQLVESKDQASLTVYLDMKSPHAYISVRPTLQIVKDYKVEIDFRPYTLSYIEMGVSTTTKDQKRRPPSADGDRKARMFYAAAREYCKLQQLPLRSPYRLLDAELAHRAFVFAKRQKLEINFMMSVCLRGWGSGWREFELESITQLKEALADIGANLTGFDAFVMDGGEGEQIMSSYKEEAHATGFVGTPHYVFYDHQRDRILGLFGREHLALIRSKLSEQGLARSEDVTAEFSHAWQGSSID